MLNTKSTSVEEAVNELISMLFFHHEPEDRAEVPENPEELEEGRSIEIYVNEFVFVCYAFVCMCVFGGGGGERVDVYVCVCMLARMCVCTHAHMH